MQEVRLERPLCKRPQEDQEKEQRKERKAMVAREQEKAKILSRKSMATAESAVTGLKLVGRHVQRHQQRRVKEVQER